MSGKHRGKVSIKGIALGLRNGGGFFPGLSKLLEEGVEGFPSLSWPFLDEKRRGEEVGCELFGKGRSLGWF